MPSTVSYNVPYNALCYTYIGDLVKATAAKATAEIGCCTCGPDPLNQYSVAYFSAVPKRIIKNGPAMVVFWKDGTKTVVKRKKGEPDNIYHAFTAALAKKIFGSNSKINSIVGSVIDETKKSKKTTKNNK